MDNKKKKRNKQKRNQYPNKNTEVLNTEEGKKENDTDHDPAGKREDKREEDKQEKKEEEKRVEKKEEKQEDKRVEKKEEKKEENKAGDPPKKNNIVSIQKNREEKTEDKKAENKKIAEAPKKNSAETVPKEHAGKEGQLQAGRRAVTEASSEQIRGIAVNAAKILLPVAACAIIIAVVISYIGSQKTQTVDNPSLNTEEQADTTSAVTLSDEPLAENAYTNVNELMQAFCAALADGDMDTVRTLKDYNTDREIITYEKKSEFIERYDNIKCYTKPGMEENSYFVYVTYEVKFKDIETKAPGLNAFYVYTAEDGSLKIDGDTEENIKAAFKLVTNQDDVVDLYNEINVKYTEATASDETLEQFMTDLPVAIRESVGVVLAQLETQGETTDTPQTEAGGTQPAETEASGDSEELPQNQVVNQIVRTTDTVNVRSSDSEEADKIGKAQAGTELKRVEDRVNGWSKVIFEDREAYIKSDYLEVVTAEAVTETVGTVMATTNVNVRSQASQESERIGSAQAGTSYDLLEDQGEWYMIDYNGTTGYVKAEFFVR